jgi:phosphoglycerate dehydrogenase-like enzyme
MTDLLYLPQRGNVEPWLSDFRAAAEGRVTIEVFNYSKDASVQFEGIPVVVDHGGHATQVLIRTGKDAGVRLWQILGTGVDHSEVAFTRSLGIPVATTPGIFSAAALAEHALFFLFATARRYWEATANARNGTMYRPITDELTGKMLLIIGLGASGRELAFRARALGMIITAGDVDAEVAAEADALGVSEFHLIEELDDLLPLADFVSLHVPLTDATHHLIDESRLRGMKQTATLINVARGQLVDEAALIRALTEGVISSAGVDVFGVEPLDPANPLLQLENVIATPHMAGATRETSARRCAACVENVVRVLGGEPPLYLLGE